MNKKVPDSKPSLKKGLSITIGTLPKKKQSNNVSVIPEESAESTNHLRSTEEESISPGMDLIRNCREAHIKVELSK